MVLLMNDFRKFECRFKLEKNYEKRLCYSAIKVNDCDNQKLSCKKSGGG